jgi:hypothetical protein
VRSFHALDGVLGQQLLLRRPIEHALGGADRVELRCRSPQLAVDPLGDVVGAQVGDGEAAAGLAEALGVEGIPPA